MTDLFGIQSPFKVKLGSDIDGTENDDHLNGSSGDDTIDGFGGDDTINAGNGGDLIDGGDGDDFIQTGNGDDIVTGGEGDDTINGNGGSDTAIYAGSVAEYALSTENSRIIVDDLNTADGDDGTDSLHDVDYIQFYDYTVDLTGGTNNAPVAVVADQTTDEDSPTDFGMTLIDFDGDSVVAPSLSVSSTNAMDVTLPASVSVISGPTPGSTGLGSATGFGLHFDPGDGYQWLAAGESTTETVTVTSTDDQGGSFVQTFDVTITGVNDAPEANDVATSVSESGNTTIAADFTDVDLSDNHTFSLETIATTGNVTNNGDGTFSYDTNGLFEYLAVGETATDSFIYTVDDGNGGSDKGTVTITITGENDDPVANAVAAAVGEDGPGTTVSADFTDIDTSDSHTFSIDTTGTVGSVTDNGDGTFSYDPNGQFETLAVGETATDTFTYTVDDGNGGSDTATVTMTINGANDDPEANDVADSVGESGSTTITADFTDIDASDSHTFSVDTALTAGTVTDNGDGTFDYDPNGVFNALNFGETATDTFTYTVDDGNGGSDTATVTMTIIGENQSPIAGAVSDSVVEVNGALIQIDLRDYVSDPDGDNLSFSNIALARSGTPIPYSVVGDGLIAINPDALLSGGLFSNDSIFLGTGESILTGFNFTVTDDSGAPNAASTGELALTINGVNEPTGGPNTAPTAYEVTRNGLDEADGQVSIAFSDLATDPDAGDTLNITSMTWVDGGGITRNVAYLGGTGGEGNVAIDLTQFFLEEGDEGLIEIAFTVQDAAGETASNTITLEIAGDTPGAGNTPPVAGNIPVGETGIEDVIVDDPGTTSLQIDLSTLVSDADGDPLTITVDGFVFGYDPATEAPNYATYSFDNVTGIVTIDFADLGLADGENQIGSLLYSVTDGIDTAHGTVDYNYIDPADTAPPAQSVFDFEPFSSDSGAFVAVTVYDTIQFRGSAIAYETDELVGNGDGRDGSSLYDGLINGQTTPGGNNVLAGTFTTIEVPVLDETGEPVLDERGAPIYEIVLDEEFSLLAANSTAEIGGDPVQLAGFAPAGLTLADFPIEDYGFSTFDFDGLSLNTLGADNVTVTMTTYGLSLVETPFNASFSSYTLEQTELDTFEFIVNASDGAELLDFNAVDFADDAAGVDDITHFDGIFAVTFATDTGVPVVLDDLLITL
ncbi:beta strand repeat-containing protein [Thalassovita sp.]|uniref:beta strand repeat-containing protein n=1 Tax=Thalassovita sp. TaxID=1979401 RepID=UPI002B2699A6|nr:Ig-like domain-containing protein [Thalassovita sp.]